MDDAEIRREILTKLAVPVWPVAGKALGLGRHAARTAAARGDIPTLKWAGKQAPVPTSWLRQVLGLSDCRRTCLLNPAAEEERRKPRPLLIEKDIPAAATRRVAR